MNWKTFKHLKFEHASERCLICRNHDIPKIMMKEIKEWADDAGYTVATEGCNTGKCDLTVFCTKYKQAQHYSFESDSFVDSPFRDVPSDSIYELLIFSSDIAILTHFKLSLLE